MSQKALAKAIGYSQQRINWLEKGDMERPERVATLVLANALQTTIEWLLYGDGQKDIGPRFLPTKILAEKYDQLAPEQKAKITELIENTGETDKPRKRA